MQLHTNDVLEHKGAKLGRLKPLELGRVEKLQQDFHNQGFMLIGLLVSKDQGAGRFFDAPKESETLQGELGLCSTMFACRCNITPLGRNVASHPIVLNYSGRRRLLC